MKPIRIFVIAAMAAVMAVGCDKTGPETSEPVRMDAPTGVTLTGNTGTAMTFGWNRVKDAVAYAARLETEDGQLVSQSNPVEPSVGFDKLTRGATYVFKVRAKGENGNTSDYSEPLKAVAGETGTGEVPDEPEVPENPDDPDNPETPEWAYEAMKIPAYEEELGALAFPGAEGGGMYTTGGRGGKVLHVTNLNDSGEGSLRAAVEASGTRTIVFDVAGTIALQSKLRIRNGNLTIAGQTAPGDGICIRNYATVVEADNVIIRFVRFRLGDKGPNADDGEDAIWGRYHNNIILDHCSMSWSIDECASFYGNENFTMQWCILTESLRNSIHDKGNHGYGGIWGGKNASFHHNMLANHQSRNPRFDHPEIYQDKTNPARRGHVDYRNNVVYNWGDNSTYGGEGAWFNMVNNYYKKGKASKDRKYFIDANGIYTSSKTDYGYPCLYLSGNVYVGKDDLTADNKAGVYWHDHSTNNPPDASKLAASQMDIKGKSGQDCYTSTHTAADAFSKICELGGASLRRDAVDTRACTDAKNGTPTFNDGGNGSTGGLIDTQEAVGGWPDLKATAEELAACKDSDKDGIPDWFEEKFGLDRNNASDASLKTIDVKGRYSNLEMYLHYIVRDIVEKQAENSTYTSLK